VLKSLFEKILKYRKSLEHKIGIKKTKKNKKKKIFQNK